MPRTILVIEGDASALRRVFSEVREEGRSAAAAVAGEWKKAGDETSKAFRKMRRDAGKALSEIKALESELSYSAQREAERRQQMAQTEGSYRVSARRRAADGEKRVEEDVTRHQQQQSRRRISDAEREARSIQRISARWGERVGGAAVSAGTQFAGAIHGEVQSARQRRAGAERNLGLAIYQAGGGRQDVVSARQRVTQFAAQQNMDPAELAAALNAAQTEFSTLGNRSTSRGDRNARLEGFLQTAQLARDTGNNVSEFGRLQGLFSTTGFDAGTQRALLLQAAGLAQRGAIETGSVTREAMPAITARMNAAMTRLGPGATAADRQRAAQGAFGQSMAEIEVLRGSTGESARAIGNTMRNANQRLAGTVGQQKILTNIRNMSDRATRERLEASLFEADPTRRGQRRLRSQFTDATTFAQEFGRIAGNDPTRLINTFAGGGHGNPMGFLANERRMLGALLGADTEGQTAAARVKELRGEGVALTEADVSRGRETFTNDAQSQLTAEQTAHDNALTDNTSKLVELSNRFASWSAQNPVANAALGTVGSVAGGVLGQGAGRVAGGAAGRVLTQTAVGRAVAPLAAGGGLATGGIAATLAGAGLNAYGWLSGETVGGRRLTGGQRATRALTGGEGLGSLAMAAFTGGASVPMMAAFRGFSDLFGGGGGGARPNGQAPITPEALQQAVQQGVQAGIQGSGGVPVRMNPVEQAHAQAQATGQRRPPAP